VTCGALDRPVVIQRPPLRDPDRPGRPYPHRMVLQTGPGAELGRKGHSPAPACVTWCKHNDQNCNANKRIPNGPGRTPVKRGSEHRNGPQGALPAGARGTAYPKQSLRGPLQTSAFAFQCETQRRRRISSCAPKLRYPSSSEPVWVRLLRRLGHRGLERHHRRSNAGGVEEGPIGEVPE